MECRWIFFFYKSRVSQARKGWETLIWVIHVKILKKISWFSEDRCRELEETVTSLQEELASKRVTDEDRVAAVSEDGDELTQIRIQLENSKKELEKMAASNERLELHYLCN